MWFDREDVLLVCSRLGLELNFFLENELLLFNEDVSTRTAPNMHACECDINHVVTVHEDVERTTLI